MQSPKSGSVTSVSVEFTDLDFMIPVSRKQTDSWFGKTEKSELHAVKKMSARIESGRLTAILGPSGSGKTTLLNILAGRASKASIAGSKLGGVISLNGLPIDPLAERTRFAYVLSEDSIHGLLTPEECLRFALDMRHSELSEDAKSARVNATIEELGIEHCRSTYVGNELVKGISSGERKRTSVGIEIINDPLVCFVDEGTTGLDSYSAYQLVSLLKTLAGNGRCVLSTIHQPASETFALFDDVIFLAKGAMIYHGPVKNVREYFGKFGHKCPDNFNPADFVMNLIQTLPEDEMSKLVNAWIPHMDEEKKSIELARAEVKSEHHILPKENRAPFLDQFSYLATREKKLIFRDSRFIGMRIMVPIFLNLLIGGILWKRGQHGGTVFSDQAHVAAITFIAISSMMSTAQPLLLTFPFERPVFLREHSGGLYDVAPYFLSKMLWETPIVAVQVAIIAGIGYGMTHLQGNWGIIYSGAFALATAASALAIALGAFAKTVREAAELSPIIFMPQFIFAGLWIRIDTIPVALRWIQWIIPMKYAINIMYYGEFRHLTYGPGIMEANNVYTDELWKYYVLVFVIIIIIRAFGLGALKLSSRKTVY